MLIAGLPTSHKIGLGLVALAFVAFALTSSFLLPRLRPQFPGKGGVAGFVAVTVLFFCSMIAAVWFFGKEPKEAKAGGEGPQVTTTQAQPAPATTAAATTTTAAPTTQATTTAAQPAPAGPCHTFKPAGATGKVGPDLDNLAADAQKANHGALAAYTAESIKDPGAYVVPGFPNGVMPTFASLGEPKIADLVAFLTQKS